MTQRRNRDTQPKLRSATYLRGNRMKPLLAVGSWATSSLTPCFSAASAAFFTCVHLNAKGDPDCFAVSSCARFASSETSGKRRELSINAQLNQQRKFDSLRPSRSTMLHKSILVHTCLETSAGESVVGGNLLETKR